MTNPNREHLAGLELALSEVHKAGIKSGTLTHMVLKNLLNQACAGKESAVHGTDQAKAAPQAEPVAYAAFADNGNIRMWCRSALDVTRITDEHGNKAVPLYTHPPAPDAELIELLRDCYPGCGLTKRETQALRARIDAKLAQLRTKGE